MDFLHFIMYSLLLWQIVLGVYVILLWAKRNIKFEKQNVVVQNQTSSHIIDDTKVVNKNLGVIEVDVKKQLNISDADISDLKLDEEIKGKVKTQKDKLKKLRG